MPCTGESLEDVLTEAIAASIWSPKTPLVMGDPEWVRCIATLNGNVAYCHRCHEAHSTLGSDVGRVCPTCHRGRLVPGEAMLRRYGLDRLAEWYVDNVYRESMQRWVCEKCARETFVQPDGGLCTCGAAMTRDDGMQWEP
ncbi:MAG TPA: hypothetical protein VM238_03130 [Phycisphaerae bacterium]|nr:hypothetical protein [Phycisphaerae bacterium]